MKEAIKYIKTEPTKAIIDILFVVMIFLFTYTVLCFGSIIQ